MNDLRILHDDPLDGASNMARDEALLVRVGEGLSLPTLRLYTWREPTISLGYFQHYADVGRLDPALHALPVVRRLTGGGAILHDLELTYSLTAPLGHVLLAGGPNALYQQAHDAVIACLADLGIEAWRGCRNDDSGAAKGPFFCFARRHCFDVLIGQDKIAGSAQRRTPRAILQHGSIIVASRFAQQPVATVALPPKEAVSRVRRRFVAHWSGTTLSGPDGPGLVVHSGTWSPDELACVKALVPKYAGEAWTRRV